MEIISVKQIVIKFFEGNPIFNIITLVLAISGIVFTIYYYYKSKKVKIPTYVVRTINLVREKIQKIETVQILYSGEKINNLSISKIAFWNEGRETINFKDVAKSNSLRVVIEKEFNILDCEVLYQKNPANDFNVKVSEDNKRIDISFDYFDFEEGIVLQIFHTGNANSDIKMTGSFKSVNQIKRKEFSNSILPKFFTKAFVPNNNKSNRSINRSIIGWTMLIIGIIYIVISPFYIHRTEAFALPSEIYNKILVCSIGIPYIWYGYRTLKRSIPKGFDIFNDEF